MRAAVVLHRRCVVGAAVVVVGSVDPAGSVEPGAAPCATTAPWMTRSAFEPAISIVNCHVLPSLPVAVHVYCVSLSVFAGTCALGVAHAHHAEALAHLVALEVLLALLLEVLGVGRAPGEGERARGDQERSTNGERDQSTHADVPPAGVGKLRRAVQP